MSSNLSGTIGSLLTVALMTSGGGASHNWALGSHGYGVAQVQADLGVLGFDPGPVKGIVTKRLWQSANQYIAIRGLTRGASLSSRLAATMAHMGTIPQDATGPLRLAMLAVQDDLKTVGLYQGALDGRWSKALSRAVIAFQRHTGQSPTGTLTAPTLRAMAHWTAVAVTARRHWRYQAQPQDTYSELAWAADLPYSGFVAANGGGTPLKAGQVIRWVAATPKPSPAPSGTVPRSHPPSQPSTPLSTGVLANLDPVSDLVVLNPSGPVAAALVAAERQAGARIDLSISGQWALTHLPLVKQLAALGNEIAVNGYSGANLNQLPAWGVNQELKWAVHAVESETGSAPSFLFTAEKPDSAAVQAAGQQNLTALWAALTVGNAGGIRQTTAAVEMALIRHPNQAVMITAPVDWAMLFKQLASRHFVFETLGQIWASH